MPSSCIESDDAKLDKIFIICNIYLLGIALKTGMSDYMGECPCMYSRILDIFVIVRFAVLAQTVGKFCLCRL